MGRRETGDSQFKIVGVVVGCGVYFAIVSMKVIPLALIVLFIAAAGLFGQCPSIGVIGPAGVTNPGDEMRFSVDVGSVGPRLQFVWTINEGTIVSGQGTQAITIATKIAMAGSSVIATVRVEGLPTGCEKIYSETAPIAPIAGCGSPSDEWGKLKPNDQRLRLDNVFAELRNNPTNIGFLMLNITQKERLDSGNERIQFILKHAAFIKFDSSRLWFALAFADEPRTRFYRMPIGSEDTFPCDECLIIKGGDL